MNCDALILLDGEIPDPGAARRAARGATVICADGGLRHARALGIKPHFVVGDMDSLPRPLAAARGLVFWCDFDEERSDFEKALEFAVGLGASRVSVAGVLGGRFDHSLVNLALIGRFSRRLELVVLAGGEARLLGTGTYRLGLKKGERFSVLAAPAAKASLRGARYALKRAALESGSRGLGNTAMGPVRLDVHEGRLWLIR